VFIASEWSVKQIKLQWRHIDDNENNLFFISSVLFIYVQLLRLTATNEPPQISIKQHDFYTFVSAISAENIDPFQCDEDKSPASSV